MTKSTLLILLLLVQSAFFINVNGQVFKNLDFSQYCDSSKTGLCNWDLSWGGNKSVGPDKVNGRNALLITGKTEKEVGFTEQSVSVTPFPSAHVIHVTAMVKSEGVVGKGAGLNIGLYNSEGVLIATKDMGGFYSVDWIQGTSGWKKYSVSLVVPVGTAKIKTGAILFGKGKVWFSEYTVNIANLENRKPSKLAMDYITAACDSIRKHSLVRDSINIDALKETALKIAGPAKTYSDCYLAVGFLLESLRPYGDEHSFFMNAREVKNWKSEGSQVMKIQFPEHKVVDGCGYVLVPPFHGGNPKQMLAYADAMQKAIQKIADANVSGWIIDLRQNTGGNMSPMIAGLGPLFSAEKLGGLIDVNGDPSYWYYSKGRFYWDNEKGWSVTNPVTLKKRLPIAVLTSSQTGSSGEIVVVSFLGNEKTKSFGQPTWGLTTGNGSFDLKDGSQIYLASTIMSDRNGRQFRQSISPDFVIETKPNEPSDRVLEEAIQWIKSNQ